MKVSVIVPSFNQARYLEETLQSVLSQQGPIEVIVQDGGSTDGSVDILKKYNNDIIWQSGPDNGQAAAINLGLKKSTGEILCYLNSDDVWLPDTLQRVRGAFAGNPAADFVYGQADFVDEYGRSFRKYPVEKFDYRRLLQTCYICQPACFWQRRVYERWGGFDESLNYNLDYEYWLRVGQQTNFVMLPAKLAQSRFHADAKSVKDKVKIHWEALGMLERYSICHPDLHWLRGYARSCADATQGGFLAYAREYGRRIAEVRQRYCLTPQETAWLCWKLVGSYQFKNRMPFS